MADARYFVQAVEKREGDKISGQFLRRSVSLPDAFSLVGEAIEKDEGPDGRNLLYIIRDEEDDSRSWTIMERMS
jgi:hypothetical protein